MNEQEKINELMKPRYKVIADYPGASFIVGAILEPEVAVHYVMNNEELEYERFPHLFRKLEWWEERKPEEMPEYFKTSNDDFYKADEWNPDDHYGWIATSRGRCYHRSHILPATAADYQAFITKPVNQG